MDDTFDLKTVWMGFGIVKEWLVVLEQDGFDASAVVEVGKVDHVVGMDFVLDVLEPLVLT